MYKEEKKNTTELHLTGLLFFQNIQIKKKHDIK